MDKQAKENHEIVSNGKIIKWIEIQHMIEIALFMKGKRSWKDEGVTGKKKSEMDR